ncbi:outer membrane protein [Bradyrhizobium roseum]|uniref:outer membrane protein n=1 Tax=Bradyrhizobium roseum TaxID=3056648 RepID=UPI002602BBD7|nr:outer membrane protein [Bradyrhizobium roseus]WKA31792.1 porin family protein [Bradyrhizobium roseus]
MKQLLLAGVAALSVASAASAADMQARPYKAPPPAAMISPAYNWSGFYIGAMGGFGWGSGDNEGTGGFGGGTVGYNWQLPGSQFVFGIEVDAAGASIKDSFTEDLGGGILLTQESKINSFGSVTGRAGFAMDAMLLYAKGGYAWANNKATISVPGLSVSDSQTHTGYTIGGGLEYLFTPSWSAKAEYMYTSLGGETYNFGQGALLDSGNLDFHTIKVGVNYHFR